MAAAKEHPPGPVEIVPQSQGRDSGAFFKFAAQKKTRKARFLACRYVILQGYEVSTGIEENRHRIDDVANLSHFLFRVPPKYRQPTATLRFLPAR